MSNGEGKIARMIQPQDFEGAFAMAERLCLSELIPKGFKPKLKQGMSLDDRRAAIEVSAASIVIAWEMGAELGLSAMTSLQSIAVINGKPNLYGETPLAVVMASGKLDYIKETLDEEKRVATCEVKRVGMELVVTKTFSMKEADEAEMYEFDAQGNGKWKKLSERSTYRSFWRDMLMYRARGRALKALFADVLKGIEIQEASLETGGPEAGTIIDGVAEEVKPDNPFASAKKDPPPDVPAPVVQETTGDATPKARKPRASKQSTAAEETPGAAASNSPSAAGASGAAAAENTDPICKNVRLDPICKNVRLDDGVRCSGPAGHEPPCLYVAAGSDDCPTSGCWGGLNHEGDHTFDPDGGRGSEQTGAVGAVSAAVAAGEGRGADVPVSAAAAETPASTVVPPEAAKAPGTFPGGVHPAASPTSGEVVEPGPQTFLVGDRTIETAGMTEAQFRESLTLGTRIDKDHRYANKTKWPYGYSRELLRRMMNLADAKDASRKNLTKALGEKYLAIQRQAAEAGSPQAEIPK